MQFLKKVEQNFLFGPGPVQVSDETRCASIAVDMLHRSRQFSLILRETRAQLASLLGGGQAVLIPGSATYSIESAISSVVDIDKKCLILVNGSYGHRLVEICSTHDIDYTVLDFGQGGILDYTRIELELSRGEFSSLLVVHHETSVGMVNDLEQISRLASRFKVLLLVDIVSSVGCELITLPEKCWCVVGTSGKAIEGHPGIGFVVASDDIWANLGRSNIYSLDLATHYASQSNDSVAFTMPVQNVLSLRSALKQLSQETVCGRQRRYELALKELTEGMKNLGFKYVEVSGTPSSSLAQYELPDGLYYSDLELYLSKIGVDIYPALGMHANIRCRISVMGPTVEGKIDFLLSSLSSFVEMAAK